MFRAQALIPKHTQELADCLAVAARAAREGRPFRMAELGSGPLLGLQGLRVQGLGFRV